MKIVTIEEHFGTPGIRDAWTRLAAPPRDDSQDLFAGGGGDVQARLEAADAVPLARRANDLFAAAVRRRPDRFGGFATLPTPAPAAARELERAVSELGLQGAMLCGRTREKNADHPDFLPI